MFFEELVEQHRVHHFVAHAFHLAFVVARHEIRVHFFYFLGDKAKSECLCGIKLLFKSVADRLKRKERFAGLVQRLDVLLVTSRRDRNEMAKSAGG